MNAVTFLSHPIDIVIFIIFAVLALCLGRCVIRRKRPELGLPWFVVFFGGILVLAGIWFAEFSSLTEAELGNDVVHMRAVGLSTAALLVLILVSVSVLVTLMRAEINQRTQIEKELVRAKELAEKANHAKSEFLAHISHELRTPMNSIIGFGDLLLDTPLTGEQKEFATTIRKSGAALLALLNNILDLSKIEANETKLESIPFSLREIIEDVANLLKPGIAKKNLVFDLQNQAGDISLIGDPTRLRQVLLNLAHNAVKFTAKGRVTLRAEWSQGVLRCDVSDTGIGIPADKLAILFRQFTQADASITRTYGGTGLGLVISRELVRLMGGSITVESEPDQGTTFTIRVPVPQYESPLPAAAPSPLVHSERSASTAKSGHVLIVEDNVANRRLFSVMLGKLGYTFDVAVNGKDAVAVYPKHHYDAVLMDCEMPELNGFEATREIRAMEKASGSSRRVPIIAVTANAMAGTRVKCLEAGMDHYLTKPLRIEILSDTLSSYVVHSSSTSSSANRPPS